MKVASLNERRFLELLAENRSRILKICRVYGWATGGEDDLYQEIVFQIWRALPNLKEDARKGNPGSWFSPNCEVAAGLRACPGAEAFANGG